MKNNTHCQCQYEAENNLPSTRFCTVPCRAQRNQRKAVKKVPIFPRTQDCINALKTVSDECKSDLHAYHHKVIEWQNTASKRTHYDQLEDWSNPAYGFIHDMLHKYGFVNGDPEANAKNANASFWWNVYGLLGSIIYSPYLKSEVAYHHSSAFERNRALLAELNIILDQKP